MLRALIESADQFNNLAEVGYDAVRINWILNLAETGAGPELLGPFRRDAIEVHAPVVGDRSGTVSETNSKPALLVDRAAYSLGVHTPGEIDTESIEHRGFCALALSVATETKERDVEAVSAFLSRFGSADAAINDPINNLKDRIRAEKMRPKDMVAFRASPDRFAFEAPKVAAFWRESQASAYVGGEAACSLCGQHRPSMRILPWQVSFAGYSCPISASNRNAFDSFGKEQTANSPMCFDCASKASQVLQYLVSSERYSRVLTRDDSKGQGKSPLRNQVAVFWLKEPLLVEAEGEEQPIRLEEAFAEPLFDGSERTPAPDPEHVKAFYGVPWSHQSSALKLDRNRFYLAVLSPNKSRLVLREWIDQSLDAVCERLQAFDTARCIVRPDGSGVYRAPIPEMLKALKPWRSSTTTLDANHVRGLVRTAYAGAAVPGGLLESAVRRFRISDRPKNGIEQEQMEGRRAALAAVIKLALTYGAKEAQTLQKIDEGKRTAPYLCGQLLAVLEEAQARASSRRIGATLVDRFYGSASTAPGGVLTLLIKRATQDHFPKVRKNNLGYGKLSEKLENAMTGIDEAGGFPTTLSMWEQGEFALGFYHQRAAFRSLRPQVPVAVKPTDDNSAGRDKQ